MAEFELPTYYLYLNEQSTRSRIEAAKPGQTVQVLVCSAEDSSAAPIVAMGTRTADGSEFNVVVTTEAGDQSHSREWWELSVDLKFYEEV